MPGELFETAGLTLHYLRKDEPFNDKIWLTNHGREAEYSPFQIGSPVQESQTNFYGKGTLLEDITRRVRNTGVVAIEGGYQSGKTSLLNAVSHRLKTNENVVASLICILGN